MIELYPGGKRSPFSTVRSFILFLGGTADTAVRERAMSRRQTFTSVFSTGRPADGPPVWFDERSRSPRVCRKATRGLMLL